MIKPTVGRIVLFRPNGADVSDMAFHGDYRLGPLAAIVTHVWSDTCVNLAIFDSNGNAHTRTSVTLHQGEGRCASSPYCEWMEYQKGQAAKTEALEAEKARA